MAYGHCSLTQLGVEAGLCALENGMGGWDPFLHGAAQLAAGAMAALHPNDAQSSAQGPREQPPQAKKVCALVLLEQPPRAE
eukprot:CAMPEP_0202372464 /NCGR_PEP_ID=MMETSP1127-20130417/3672_1 /ASSEMBLY_ACC=CAM_ASM_000462 /TAXON_ID=3047 /ORGANISM="Dunaliella tertiolecta, Strain CCMP1320" /LENGTH=80 /DNA_ID=CAMNT_0048969029 /DNA_START=284 /DNA_END=523 /DNA_ORIENTATION=-